MCFPRRPSLGLAKPRKEMMLRKRSPGFSLMGRKCLVGSRGAIPLDFASRAPCQLPRAICGIRRFQPCTWKQFIFCSAANNVGGFPSLATKFQSNMLDNLFAKDIGPAAERERRDQISYAFLCSKRNFIQHFGTSLSCAATAKVKTKINQNETFSYFIVMFPHV